MNQQEAWVWLKFYANLIAINIWNGSLLYLKALIPAAGIEALRGFDVRSIPPSSIFWTWLSVVFVHIVIELNKHMIPNPKPPV
jgi:hypothetical protein